MSCPESQMFRMVSKPMWVHLSSSHLHPGWTSTKKCSTHLTWGWIAFVCVRLGAGAALARVLWAGHHAAAVDQTPHSGVWGEEVSHQLRGDRGKENPRVCWWRPDKYLKGKQLGKSNIISLPILSPGTGILNYSQKILVSRKVNHKNISVAMKTNLRNFFSNFLVLLQSKYYFTCLYYKQHTSFCRVVSVVAEC